MTDQLIPGITFQASSGKSIEDIIATLGDRDPVEPATAFSFLYRAIPDGGKAWILRILRKANWNMVKAFPEMKKFIMASYADAERRLNDAPIPITEFLELHALFMEHIRRSHKDLERMEKTQGNN